VPARLLDVAVNVLIYMPFGFAVARLRPRRTAWWVLGLALSLSLFTELTQVFSHGRYPSVRDVCVNVFGACLGAALERGVRRRQPVRNDI
jgi:glycopeptide antibiotics resistance protein